MDSGLATHRSLVTTALVRFWGHENEREDGWHSTHRDCRKNCSALGELCCARRHSFRASARADIIAGRCRTIGASSVAGGHDQRAAPQATAKARAADQAGQHGTGRAGGNVAVAGGAGGARRPAGFAHRNGRRLRQQHIGRDQDQHAADQHSAVGQCSDQELHPGPELPERHRRHALRSRRRRPSGRGQSRRTCHSRRRFERELLRQRLPRRRSDLPRSLQHAKHRGAEGTERAHLRPRRPAAVS